MAKLSEAIDQFTNQLAEIGPIAFDGYTGGFKQYLIENQNKISGGFINPDRTQDQKMVIYGDDQAAYDNDLTEFRTWFCNENTTPSPPIGEECFNTIILNLESPWASDSFPVIKATVDTSELLDPLPESLINNISQLMSVDRTVVPVDPGKAEEVLKGRKIHELITSGKTRQDKIDEFFEMYSSLKIPDYPSANDSIDADEDGTSDTWQPGFEDGGTDTYPIGYAQHGISVEGGGDYIPWRIQDQDGDNENQSLEWLRNDLNEYFLPGEYLSTSGDERPIYENRSKGYLKIRNLNHAIIIRNEEGSDVGLTTPVVMDVGGTPYSVPKWQAEGFTITMWVRFLNVTNSGTLFNFGNPLRQNNSEGFMLDTIIRDGRRYARLVVRDWAGDLRDSHFGGPNGRLDTVTAGNYSMDFLDLDYTEIPVDLKEWYFIVATYDRLVAEDDGPFDPSLTIPAEYWNWNCNDTDCTEYTSYSGLGAQCKVEIISRSDLLRARGYNI